MTTYYKAVRPDGKDFRTGTIDYTAAVVKHPSPKRGSDDASQYISISTESGDCTGFRWPARLFEVKPVGKTWTPHPGNMPNKRAAVGVTIMKELPAHQLFGPQGEAVVAIIDRFSVTDTTARRKLYNLRGSDWYNALSGAGGSQAGRAGLGAARSALDGRLVGWDSSYGAALAVLLRHTIGEDGFTQDHYNALTAPWVAVTGNRAHPEDAVI